MNNTVSFNTVIPQVSFSAKNKNLYKIIDIVNDSAVELANKDRPIVEKKETAIRKSLERIFKKLGFGKKLRNAGETKNTEVNNIAENFSLDDGIELMKKNLSDIGIYFKENNIL